MLRKTFARPALLILPLALVGAVAHAAIFPDVPEGHIYHEPITMLVGAEVINGNPDGNFYPDRAVNRAEMLKMLYKATGKVPDPSNVRCFPDVIPGSWYESYVCDSAANRVVNGYPDGTFKPAQEVNRVEALKMIMNLFDMDVPNITDEDRDVVKFVDVSVAAWYTKYLYAAFAKQILPIPGQGGARYYPDWPLLRGEAAAYIYNALNVDLMEEREEAEKAQEEEQSSAEDEDNNTEDGDDGSNDSDSGRESRQAPAEPTETSHTPTEADVSFPFDYSGKFDAKKPYSLLFDLPSAETVSVEVSLKGSGEVTCRLYLLDEGGFSHEYYLGHQEGNKCYIHNAVSPGSYQLQLQPSLPDKTFTVLTEAKDGDGNDGFDEAKAIARSKSITAVLDVNDITDWYMFSVGTDDNLIIEVSNSQDLDCLIYADPDVDLFGFSGPECNQTYRYPAGTYYVAVSRKTASKTARKTYTIQLR